jgi:hypothetical protein
MNCTNCGKEISDTAKVCGYCGHRLIPAPPSKPVPEPSSRPTPIQPPKNAPELYSISASEPPPPLPSVKTTKKKEKVPPKKRAPIKGWLWLILGVVGIMGAVWALFLLGILPRPLYDDFSNPKSGFPTFTTDNGEVGYTSQGYRIAFSKSEGFNSAWSYMEYDDFAVETSFSVPAGSPEMGAGLTLRAATKRWYLVWIYPNTHKYIFIKDVDGRYKELIPSTYSNIIQASKVGNRLRLDLKVIAQDDTFEIWVAQPGGKYQLVDTVHDSELTQGFLGPAADSPKGSFSPPAEVFFYWIKVSK